MIGLDTSFLVALAAREHADHERCQAVFEEEIVGRSASMCLAAQALAEFTHVITDERRFEHPLRVSDALDLCEQWWHADECRPAPVDAEVGALFLAWMRQFRLGRKRLLDTLLAATYHRAGATRVATTNWRDFATFGVFDVVLL